jgi:hypothetical protein
MPSLNELYELTALDACELLTKGEISSRELTAALLDRIEAVEPQVKAFLTVTADEALAQAAAIDARHAAGGSSVQYEPSRQLLEQCGDREFLWQSQARTDPSVLL